jgi:hypothetical protein
MDGGLERLVRILQDFCLCPPPPENAALVYGLSPPSSRPPKLIPTLNPQSFDKHAAYRFSLAFQCVVNIGVRGSEPIRSRVVQAGTLQVVGCILEAWLANKGFVVGPSSSATGLPRETREQRHARKQALQEQRQREEALELDRALQRSIHLQQRRGNDAMRTSPGPSSARLSDTETSTDNSTAATPQGSNTPTASVIATSRDRSGTIIARTVLEDLAAPAPRPRTRRPPTHRQGSDSPSDTSRPETETEDDGDVEGDDGDGDVSMERAAPRRHRLSLRNRTVGIASDDPNAAPIQDAHIIINDAPDGVRGDDGNVVEDLASLEQNDDFAMGAPPGAPGAIEEGTTPRTGNRRATIVPGGPDATPRAGLTNLPMTTEARVVAGQARNGPIPTRNPAPATNNQAVTATPTPRLPGRNTTTAYHHRHDNSDSGPYRDEDVLLSLQLLAYLSKYPHVRQAFYKPCVTFHPASANLQPGSRPGPTPHQPKPASFPGKTHNDMKESLSTVQGFFKAFSSSTRGKEKERTPVIPPYSGSSSSSSNAAASSSRNTHSSSSPSTSAAGGSAPGASAAAGEPEAPPPRQTNVFSLVERFTFRPSSSENDLPNPPPRLPVEIQYWAGVIMRNACRKDDSRGGIRQCANMLCGRWESYPREFAKCRRCRKAKYCGKDCQSTAWSEGHRFWCSAKEPDEDVERRGGGAGGGGGGGAPDGRDHHHRDHRDRGDGRQGPVGASSASTTTASTMAPSQNQPADSVDEASGGSDSAPAMAGGAPDRRLQRDRTIRDTRGRDAASVVRASATSSQSAVSPSSSVVSPSTTNPATSPEWASSVAPSIPLNVSGVHRSQARQAEQAVAAQRRFQDCPPTRSRPSLQGASDGWASASSAPNQAWVDTSGQSTSASSAGAQQSPMHEDELQLRPPPHQHPSSSSSSTHGRRRAETITGAPPHPPASASTSASAHLSMSTSSSNRHPAVVNRALNDRTPDLVSDTSVTGQ